jgi:transposase
MYIRTVARKNKDGSETRYVQLAHNYRDKESGQAKANVLFNFGREEEVDKDALKRLVQSIYRFLGPEEAMQSNADKSSSLLRFISSKPLGGAWFLDCLWQRIGVQNTLQMLLQSRKYASPVERAIFAMVANRALAPGSKSAVERWVSDEVFINNLTDIPVQNLYRAMDFLLEAESEIQHDVFFSVANLFNLEVDLLYFDTTSTYFETEITDEDFRKPGFSKDHRPDLPQAVIGLAVTRDGIPVRCWVWPGNTADMSVVNQVKKDLVGWKLGRVITVVDRGFVSEENLRTFQRAGGHYIAGEKMRNGKPDTEQALSTKGRYHTVKDNLEVKEIVVGDGEARKRYVLVRNPKQAEKDRLRREKILKELEQELRETGQLKGTHHNKASCRLMSHPTYGRYLKMMSSGLLKIDTSKIKEEEKLDGKYLIRTSDDTLSAEDIALGYKQLLEVESAFRTLKSTLELRPVYHRLEDRIRAHVLLCWLALLMVRIAENELQSTWPRILKELQKIHLGEFQGQDGLVWQCTELTPIQKGYFRTLKLKEPPRFMKIQPVSCESDL